jgi:hypothetical protein
MILILTGFTFLIEPPIILMKHQEALLADGIQTEEERARSLSLSLKSVGPFSEMWRY